VRVLSVNIGRPQEREWKGLRVLTSIFKYPVEGEVRVGSLDLEGDEQADLSVHGGADKAVYLYPSEHYAYWKERLPEEVLTMGNFGENLTTDGVLESDVCVGDELEIGTARVAITQPRLPCYKLQVRFNREEMTKRFYESRRFGFYFRVLREGTVAAGSAIRVVDRDPAQVTVSELIRLYTKDSRDPDLLRRAVSARYLPAGWRQELQERAQSAASNPQRG